MWLSNKFFLQNTAIHVKRTRRSSPWLILNVIDLHSGVKVHRRLVASVSCNFKELNLGINLPEQLPSFNVPWKMKSVVSGFPSRSPLLSLCNLTASKLLVTGRNRFEICPAMWHGPYAILCSSRSLTLFLCLHSCLDSG